MYFTAILTAVFSVNKYNCTLSSKVLSLQKSHCHVLLPNDDAIFSSFVQVTLNAKSLSTELTVKNTDSKAFSFSTALHTYFRVSDRGRNFDIWYWVY